MGPSEEICPSVGEKRRQGGGCEPGESGCRWRTREGPRGTVVCVVGWVGWTSECMSGAGALPEDEVREVWYRTGITPAARSEGGEAHWPHSVMGGVGRVGGSCRFGSSDGEEWGLGWSGIDGCGEGRVGSCGCVWASLVGSGRTERSHRGELGWSRGESGEEEWNAGAGRAVPQDERECR